MTRATRRFSSAAAGERKPNITQSSQRQPSASLVIARTPFGLSRFLYRTQQTDKPTANSCSCPAVAGLSASEWPADGSRDYAPAVAPRFLLEPNRPYSMDHSSGDGRSHIGAGRHVE